MLFYFKTHKRAIISSTINWIISCKNYTMPHSKHSCRKFLFPIVLYNSDYILDLISNTEGKYRCISYRILQYGGIYTEVLYPYVCLTFPLRSIVLDRGGILISPIWSVCKWSLFILMDLSMIKFYFFPFSAYERITLKYRSFATKSLRITIERQSPITRS